MEAKKIANTQLKKFAGKQPFSSMVIGSFEISKLFECLVILKKKSRKKQTEKKVPIIILIGSLFSPLPVVTVRVFLTDFVKGTATNHRRWCCMEDNR